MNHVKPHSAFYNKAAKDEKLSEAICKMRGALSEFIIDGINLVNWNPIAIAGMKSGITSLLMVIVIGKPKWELNVTKICGTTAYVAMLILYVAANKYTSSWQ